MESLGSKLAEIRKRKGLSQEELSIKANINLRTIQRIEKGENEPRGHTLKSLCDVLEVSIESLLDYGKVKDINYIRFFHLSVVMGLFFPIGNIIMPAILWMTKKDKILHLDQQGKNVVNFQILWSVVSYTLAVTLFVLVPIHTDAKVLLWALILLLVLMFLVQLLYPILVFFLAKTRYEKLYYPNIIRFFR